LWLLVVGVAHHNSEVVAVLEVTQPPQMQLLWQLLLVKPIL